MYFLIPALRSTASADAADVAAFAAIEGCAVTERTRKLVSGTACE